MAPTLNNKGFKCKRKDCLFRNRGYNASHACDYAAITGRTRTRRNKPADSARCEYYFPKPKMPRRRGYSLTGPAWESTAKRLHAAGYSVEVIARALSQEPESVEAVLKLSELPKNKRPKATLSRYNWRKAEEMYKAGASDKEIALAIGCSKGRVHQWRVAYMLPTNNPKGKKVKI